MIIANKKTIAQHPVLADHFKREMAQRMEFNARQQALAEQSVFDAETSAINRALVLDKQGWLEIDRTTAEYAENTRGTELYRALQSLATPLPLGKTVKTWANVGTIHNEVKVSMDGQSPFGFDHTSYAHDADPIPMFTAGFGVNWRHELGNRTEGIALLRDSQTAKLEVYMSAIAQYALTGSDRISEAGFKGQGLKNHRNTEKVDLGASGANIDLTTAAQADVMKFFAEVFEGVMFDNNTTGVDLWVSKEIYANLRNDFTGLNVDKTILQRVLEKHPVINSIQVAYESDVPGFTTGLSGNEMLAYVNSKSFLEMPTGQAIQVVPVPRLELRANFNMDISCAYGVQVKRRGANSGVFYFAELV